MAKKCRYVTYHFKGRTYTRRQFCTAERIGKDFIKWTCPRCKKTYVWKITPPVILRCPNCRYPILIDDHLRILETFKWRDLVRIGAIEKPKTIREDMAIVELSPVEEVKKCPVCGSEQFRWTEKAIYCAKCGTLLSELVETYPVRGKPLTSTEIKGRYEVLERVVFKRPFREAIGKLIWGEPYTFRKPFNGGYILYVTRYWILYDPKLRSEKVGYMIVRNGLVIPSDAVQRYRLLLKYLGLKTEPYREKVTSKIPYVEKGGVIAFKDYTAEVERTRITPHPEYAVEAALLAVGHGLTPTQLSLMTGLPPKEVRAALKTLQRAGKVVGTDMYNNKEKVYILSYVVPPELAVWAIKRRRIAIAKPIRVRQHLGYVRMMPWGLTWIPTAKPPELPETPPVYKAPLRAVNPVTAHLIYPPAVWLDLKVNKTFVDYYPPESPYTGEREQLRFVRFATRAETKHYLRTEKGRKKYQQLLKIQESLREALKRLRGLSVSAVSIH